MIPFKKGAATASALALALLLGACRADAPQARQAPRVHGFSTYTMPLKYGPDFRHFAYLNPDAPKGGEVTLGVLGGFDTLNHNAGRGAIAAVMYAVETLDALVVPAYDEKRSFYGLLAGGMEVSPDLTSITFHLRPEARFHDGRPITAEDVVFTHAALRDHGLPIYKVRFYDFVTAIEALDRHTVRFTAKPGTDPSILPILASFGIMPKHWWEGRDFNAPLTEAPLGSGPYRVAKAEMGRSLRFERVPDYWGRDLPVNRGQHNFDAVTYRWYGGTDALVAALRAGEIDHLGASLAIAQTAAAGLPAAERGLLKREDSRLQTPGTFSGYLFNLRRPKFQDERLRQALAGLFDFETLRATALAGKTRRVLSYFPNTDVAAEGVPTGRELEILSAYRDRLPPALFERPFTLPSTRGDGDRKDLIAGAHRLLAEAGWELRDGRLARRGTGEPLTLEILYSSPRQELALKPYVETLKAAGIAATATLADGATFGARRAAADFDMLALTYGVFYPPAPNLRGALKSEVANLPGTENWAGVADPVIDELVERVATARDWNEVVALARALDRVRLWRHHAVPTFWDDERHDFYWDVLRHPRARPTSFDPAFPLHGWWYDASNPAASRESRGR
ncbi:MAG TPA: extracellular solute-binding protein [Azospirillaceae bacterium]|nr:extracellular solute-binding protein [Azospirillaceae bacterium]